MIASFKPFQCILEAIFGFFSKKLNSWKKGQNDLFGSQEEKNRNVFKTYFFWNFGIFS